MTVTTADDLARAWATTAVHEAKQHRGLSTRPLRTGLTKRELVLSLPRRRQR